MCECETMDYGLSPIEYFADLKINNQDLDDASLSKAFVDYLTKEKKIGSGLTYSQYFQRSCLSAYDEVVKILNEEQEETLYDLKIKNIVDVVTGYDPLHVKVPQQIKRNNNIRDRKIKTCLIPFEFAYIDNNGDVYPCCPAKFNLSIGNLNNDSLLDIWNSKAAIGVRKSVTSGSFRYCDYEACEYLKYGEIIHKDKINKKDSKIIPMDTNSPGRSPKIINFAYDRSCNLACPPCRKTPHQHRDNIVENTAMIHQNIFKKEIYGVERFIISGNGDPFSSEYYMDLLRNFDQSKYPDVRIKIQTNGLLLTPARWDSIAKSQAAIDWISVSVDAATEKTYRINRGGDFKKLQKNLEFISELRKSGKIERFFINFVVQANNYKEMKQFIKLGIKYGCDLIEFQNVENWGTFSRKEFKDISIQDKFHPEHKEFLKVMDDPVFFNPAVSTTKLLEYIPDRLKDWIGSGNIKKFD